jgi:hypothetical protein
VYIQERIDLFDKLKAEYDAEVAGKYFMSNGNMVSEEKDQYSSRKQMY